MKKIVSEAEIRRVISQILLEREDDVDDLRGEWQRKTPEERRKILTGPAPNPVLLGKKFAYVENQVPELRVIAQLGNEKKFIAKVYEPTATVKDPVSAGKGRHLSSQEMKDIEDEKYKWESIFVENEKYSEIMAKINQAVDFSDLGPDAVSKLAKDLYDKYKIFVPTVTLYKPVYESTSAAFQKSQYYGCTLSGPELAKELGKIATLAATRGNTAQIPGLTPNWDRLVPCIKDYTTDSYIYGIANFIVGFLGPYGFAAGIAADIIPGMILVAYFLHRKQNNLAFTYAAYTIMSLVLPPVLAKNKWLKGTASQLIVGTGLSIAIAFMVNKVAEWIFGQANVFAEEDVKKFFEGETFVNMTGEELVSKSKSEMAKAQNPVDLIDPQKLQSKYPNVF